MTDTERILPDVRMLSEGLTDCHVHIFPPRGSVPAPRFPHPEEAATLADVEKLGETHGIRRFVLTQPSFLGFDNSLILKTLAERPDELRSVIWLENTEDPASIAQFATKGVAGLRFPLKYATCLPDWSAYDGIFEAAAPSNIHIELGLGGNALVKAVQRVLDKGGQAVVAHLGMFDAELGPEQDPAFDALIEAAQSRNVWFKLSAPYRSTEVFADRACERILKDVGPDRTVWGSDWPHVGLRLNRESTYPATLSWLLRIASGEPIRRQIFETSPSHLYNFLPRTI